MRGQGSLEYLIIIAAVLAIASIVVFFLSGTLSSSTDHAQFSKCKDAASSCYTSHLLSPNDPCMACNTACVDKKGNDLLEGTGFSAVSFCKEGKPEQIYSRDPAVNGDENGDVDENGDNGETVNNAPVLSSNELDPSSGTTADFFSFGVLYSDVDGDAPTYVRIHIIKNALASSGSIYEMSKQTVSCEYTTGCAYRYGTNLLAGEYSYYFTTKDEMSDEIRLPSSGTFSGPVVSEQETELHNCESEDLSQDEKDNCYLKIAVDTCDRSLCDNITDYAVKEICYAGTEDDCVPAE